MRLKVWARTPSSSRVSSGTRTEWSPWASARALLIMARTGVWTMRRTATTLTTEASRMPRRLATRSWMALRCRASS